MKNNYVAKNSLKVNKSAVHLDRKKESKKYPNSLQQQREVDDFLSEKIKQQTDPRHNQW